MKKILALSASVVMLLSFTLQAEAGFNLGGIANKIANKAVDSAMNSGSKKQSEQGMTKEERADAAAAKQGVKITRTKVDGSVPTAFYGELDPLPPDAFEERPDWFDRRTNIYVMTNARLVAEYENMDKWRTHAKETGIGWVEPDMCRYEELGDEIHHRITALERYGHNVEAGWLDMASDSARNETYKRAVASNVEPLRKYGLELKTPAAALPGYHPERN
ncbi:hypothetical protein [Phascolarctobacterium succinatutens]|uniref:hypothetical protein n=1 Tax=Phascolarctobacterium succinatutens TaxID=626940 RepID=UPI0026EB17F8|nr:hypothetical protein [Phascolarctobacterium succinatutens]